MKRHSMVLLVAAAVAAACGTDAEPDGADAIPTVDRAAPSEGDVPSAAAADTPVERGEVAPDGSQVVRVRLRAEGLNMTPDTVAVAGQVTFVMENQADGTYQLHVQKVGGGQWKSMSVPPGGSIELSMVLGSGEYTVAAPPASGGEPAEGMRRPLVIR